MEYGRPFCRHFCWYRENKRSRRLSRFRTKELSRWPARTMARAPTQSRSGPTSTAAPPDRNWALCANERSFRNHALHEGSSRKEDASAQLLRARIRSRSSAGVENRANGGESVSQSPLKDKVLLTFLGQHPPFEPRVPLNCRRHWEDC